MMAVVFSTLSLQTAEVLGRWNSAAAPGVNLKEVKKVSALAVVRKVEAKNVQRRPPRGYTSRSCHPSFLHMHITWKMIR